MRTFKIYFLSNFQICITVFINYNHHAIYYFPMIYLFYIWKFIPFDPHHSFLPPSLLTSTGDQQSILCIYELVL